MSSDREVWDHWYRQAQAQGYRSRAAFKLIDIDDKRKVIRKGDRVLDAGCAPGSWCEVALQRVGPRGATAHRIAELVPFAYAEIVGKP